MRIPVIDSQNQPLMPTTPARARKWIESGKAIKRWSNCGQFYVQLIVEPSGRATQDIVIGIDPGKKYSGIGVQSTKFTLYTATLTLAKAGQPRVSAGGYSPRRTRISMEV